MGFSVVHKEIGHIRKGDNYTSISSFSHCFLKTSNTWKGEPKSEGYCTLTLTHQLDLVYRCFQMFPAVQHNDCHGKNRLAMPQLSWRICVSIFWRFSKSSGRISTCLHRNAAKVEGSSTGRWNSRVFRGHEETINFSQFWVAHPHYPTGSWILDCFIKSHSSHSI